jgi:heme/copper-type cytochrome/quinol oxidase subunit 4
MAADKTRNSVVGLCPACGKENEITGVTPEDIESDRKAVGGRPLYVTCEHCGKDNRVRAFLRAKEKRDEHDRKAQERNALEVERAHQDTLRVEHEQERARLELAKYVEAQKTAQAYKPIAVTIPRYKGLQFAASFLAAIALFCWLVAILEFAAMLYAMASSKTQGDALLGFPFGLSAIVLVVVGGLWYAAGEAIKAFRDLVINSWYARRGQ